MKPLFTCLFLLFFSLVSAQPGEVLRYTINSGWRFSKGDFPDGANTTIDDSGWEQVDIPHTWNAADILDDAPNYYRGPAWYRKTLQIPAEYADKRVFVYFEGANQDASVYLNGNLLGSHLGGYTAFCFDLTPHIRFHKENVLAVRLNNSYNPDVPPVGGDLCHFGGIYRNVSLVFLNPVHFDLSWYASSGVFLKSRIENSKQAVVSIVSHLASTLNTGKMLRLQHHLLDAKGDTVFRTNSLLKIDKKSHFAHTTQEARFETPALWSPETPVLYTLESKLIDARTGEVLDVRRQATGFRTVGVNAQNLITINSEPCFIKGFGKHQDYAHSGYAVPDDVGRNDILAIREMGGNLVRSHYPLAPAVYDVCDREGVMVWGKIPIMDKITHSADFTTNTKHVLEELIWQNYNRPSFIFWGYACEIFGDMDWYWPKPQNPEAVDQHIVLTTAFSKDIEGFVRGIDSTRLTANDFHTDPTPDFYRRSGLTHLNQINGWNIYQGWYHNNLDSLAPVLNRFRGWNPELPFLLAEFGAGSDSRIHTYTPTIFDFSIEYQNLLHEHYLNVARQFPWLAGMCIWTLFDFQVESRGDVMPHINNKGMLTADRLKKDAFYLHKAWWGKEPFVHIASKDWSPRVEVADSAYVMRPVSVYSNCSSLVLYHNGNQLGIKPVHNGKAVWEVPFVQGQNLLEAVAASDTALSRDLALIEYVLLPSDMPKMGFPADELCINAGQSRTWFRDPVADDNWLPDRAYTCGSFGYTGGHTWTRWPGMTAWEGIREGISRNITGTDIDPVFQTFRIGAEEYRFDVPAGHYRLSLLFAEPFDDQTRRNAPTETGADKAGERIFDVLVNDVLVVSRLNLAEQYGVLKAVTIDVDVTAGMQGIRLRFAAQRGEPVVSGIKLLRVGS